MRRTFLVAFGAFFVFSSGFNYLPFYLAGPPFFESVRNITFMYLAYVVGIAIGPVAGAISNRLGNGAAMMGGALIFGLALGLTLIKSVAVIALALLLICGGFFTIHASAAGSLNRRLTGGRGRANSLYVLFYYLGGACGITASGWAYGLGGWHGVVALGLVVLAVPLAAGYQELRERLNPAKIFPGKSGQSGYSMMYLRPRQPAYQFEKFTLNIYFIPTSNLLKPGEDKP